MTYRAKRSACTSERQFSNVIHHCH